MRRLPPPSQLVIAAYAVALLTLVYDYPLFPSPGEYSRFYQLKSLVKSGTLAIDAQLARYGDMEDKVVYAGHAYPNKAPGLAALALPSYALAETAASRLGHELPPGSAIYAARVPAVTLPAVLFLIALRRRLLARGLDERSTAALLAALAFATGLLPYGAMLMAQATTTACLGGAALLFSGDGMAGGERRRQVLGALLCGIAVACEYPLVLLAAPLLLWSWLRRPRLSSAGLLVLGLLPAVLLVLGYNAAVFGNPLDAGYGHYQDPTFRRIHGQGGLTGFGRPDPRILGELLIGTSKGLLVWSPFLVLALPGALALWRSGRRGETAALLSACLGLLLFISGYPNWHAGWTTGPRYLVPCIGLLALPIAEAVRAQPTARVLLPGLAAAGLLLQLAPVFTWPFLPDLLANPVFDLSWPLLGEGALAPSLSSLFLLPDAPGLAVAAVAVAVGLALLLRPRPLPALVVAAALVALTGYRDRGQGPALFCRAEVSYRMARFERAEQLFAQLLQEERPSPAMAQHARARIEKIRRVARLAG